MTIPTHPENLLKQVRSDQPLPPLEQWNPEFCGDIPMRISRDGRWFYQGGEIKRAAMVKMFSRILWMEGGQYFLKTPVEKVGIDVEDVPFQVISVQRLEQDPPVLVFETATGERVEADAEHPLRVEINPATGEPSPYLMIRWGMEGRIQRNVYYQLAEWVEVDNTAGVEYWTIDSHGQCFVLGEN